MGWDELADESTLERTANSLRARGIDVIIAQSGEEAKNRLLELIPKGSEVMEVSSATLNQIGVTTEIDGGDYKSFRKMITAIDDKAERDRLRKQSLAPEYGIGSVQAVTESGQVFMVSASGSQLPVYSFGATHVIWVVGTQKIVKNLDDAYRRVYEYVLPLESERVKKAYGMPGSSVNEILIVEKAQPNRIKLIFVKEKLGF